MRVRGREGGRERERVLEIYLAKEKGERDRERE